MCSKIYACVNELICLWLCVHLDAFPQALQRVDVQTLLAGL